MKSLSWKSALILSFALSLFGISQPTTLTAISTENSTIVGGPFSANKHTQTESVEVFDDKIIVKQIHTYVNNFGIACAVVHLNDKCPWQEPTVEFIKYTYMAKDNKIILHKAEKAEIIPALPQKIKWPE